MDPDSERQLAAVDGPGPGDDRRLLVVVHTHDTPLEERAPGTPLAAQVSRVLIAALRRLGCPARPPRPIGQFCGARPNISTVVRPDY